MNQTPDTVDYLDQAKDKAAPILRHQRGSTRHINISHARGVSLAKGGHVVPLQRLPQGKGLLIFKMELAAKASVRASQQPERKGYAGHREKRMVINGDRGDQ